MKKLLTCLGLVMVLAASGCTLYFGDSDDDGDTYNYCDDSGQCWTCDSYTGQCWPDGGGTGCYADSGCASGCYCDEASGSCIETGFCSTAADCPDGYICDGRASCVPGNEQCWYSGCDAGSYCDQWTGECTVSTTCGTDADCGAGWWCNGGTCNPLGCTSDTQCAGGCYCDPTTGNCNETSYCSIDADCPSGQTCDETRSTCIPDDAPPPPPPPPPACDTLTDEASCIARSDCHEILGGVNCTPECATDPNSAACHCDSYYFAACAANATN